MNERPAGERRGVRRWVLGSDRVGLEPGRDRGAVQSRGVLPPLLFDLRAALADFEFRVALANHVHPPASLDDLAIGVSVLEGTDAADNFHRVVLVGLGSAPRKGGSVHREGREYTVYRSRFNAKRLPPSAGGCPATDSS